MEIEVKRYKRLTKLTIDDKPLGSLANVRPGDCIVCFNKQDIYHINLELERRGHDCAVIYGGLPPGTKIALTKKFNDPDDPCKILVTTDAIGMGLNLSIQRVIFYSIKKPSINDEGETAMSLIPTSQALQIGGRAGRFNTKFSEGHVTTFKAEDLPVLKDILATPVDPIKTAGLYPTAEQIEKFAYYLPEQPLSKLMDIFVNLSQLDTYCFHMCNIDNFKYLADRIQSIENLALRERYVFCCAPINQKMVFVNSMFTQFATRYGQNVEISLEWLKKEIKYPFVAPQNLNGLIFQESVFDVLDLYLWLSYRFPDKFRDTECVRKIQHELDDVIHEGLCQMHNILKATKSLKNKVEQSDPSRRSIFDDFLASKNQENLTQKMLKKGMLTRQMIKELKKEWEQSDLDIKPRKK